jgi:hypothetical protein
MFRLAVGPTQPPIQWVPGALFLGIKWWGHEADHSPPCSAEVKNAWSYTSTPPIQLHGVMLSLKNKAHGQLYNEDIFMLCYTELYKYIMKANVANNTIKKSEFYDFLNYAKEWKLSKSLRCSNENCPQRSIFIVLKLQHWLESCS